MALLKDRARRSVGGKFHIRGGTAVFGTAQTVNLYESVTAVELRTDSKFRAQGALTVTAGTITLNAVNLYQRAAGTVKSDHAIVSAGGLLTKEATGAVAVAAMDADGAIQVQFCGGTPRIVFRASGTTFSISGS